MIVAAACDGRLVGRENAASYFNTHRSTFESVVAQVRLCQPEEGRISESGHIHCSRPNGRPSDLFAAMSAANTQWMRVYYDHRDPEKPLSSVHIAIYSRGFSFAGEIEEFVYESAAAAHAEYERDDDGIAIVERLPVTGPPHHWYWRRIDR